MHWLRRIAELENHLQISEKAVAEFIIDMAKDKKNVDEFKGVRCGCMRAWRGTGCMHGGGQRGASCMHGRGGGDHAACMEGGGSRCMHGAGARRHGYKM